MYCDIFQTKAWEEFKLATGYQKSYWVEGILVLQKRLPLGRSMLYSPMVKNDQLSATGHQLQEFLAEIEAIAKKERAIFYRLELNLDSSLVSRHSSLVKRFHKAFEEMQPEHNWIIDLTKSEEEILAGMKQKGRYNIKIAEENGIEITTATTIGPELETFFDQYQATGRRHRVSSRAKSYFVSLLDKLGQKEYAFVCIAKHDQKPLASAVFVAYKNECLYLFGASSDQDRGLMAPYLLHWQMIKKARQDGRKEYNFLGIAPDDDQNHPWAGITRFKKQFGGKPVDIMGSYDLVFKPIEYKTFKIAEKIRR